MVAKAGVRDKAAAKAGVRDKVAAKAGAILLPATAAFRRARVFSKWWDIYHMPYVCTRAFVKFGQPREVPRTLSNEELADELASLTEELNQLTTEVDEAANS